MYSTRRLLQTLHSQVLSLAVLCCVCPPEAGPMRLCEEHALSARAFSTVREKCAMPCDGAPWSWWCASRRPAVPAAAAPPEVAVTAAVVPPPPQGHQPPPPPAAAEAAALLVPTGAPETAVGVAVDVVATAVVATGAAPACTQAGCHQASTSTCSSCHRGC